MCLLATVQDSMALELTVYVKYITRCKPGFIYLYILLIKYWTPLDTVPTPYSGKSGSVSLEAKSILPSVPGTLHLLYRSVPRRHPPTTLKGYPYRVLLEESMAVSNGLERKWGQEETNKMIGEHLLPQETGRMSYRPTPGAWSLVGGRICARTYAHTRQEQPKTRQLSVYVNVWRGT